MANRNTVYLIRADNDRECVMRLPIDTRGGITQKGRNMIRARFYDGATDTQHGLKYALNLEAFHNGHDIAKAIEMYYAHKI